MSLLETIQQSVSEAFTSCIEGVKDSASELLGEFFQYTMVRLCDIGCLVCVGYITYICFRVMTGSEKHQDKIIDKTFLVAIMYLMLKVSHKAYFLVGGGLG